MIDIGVYDFQPEQASFQLFPKQVKENNCDQLIRFIFIFQTNQNVHSRFQQGSHSYSS